METITIREAAEKLGVSQKVIRRLVAQGKIPASKVFGPHGEEWRLEASALAGKANGAPAPASPPKREAVSPVEAKPVSKVQPADHLSFLQQHVERLTSLLGEAMERQTVTAWPGPALSADPTMPLQEAEGTLVVRVTEALQSSLRSFESEGILSVEMGSVKVLWGKPVLWRVVADAPDDVLALLSAVLSPSARWDPPGEEVHFLWACDGTGAAVWGTACGAEWFGAPFQEALRNARVERR